MKRVVIAFALVGSVWAAALSAQTAAPAPAAAQAPAGDAAKGHDLFLGRGCWTCHGYDAHGGSGSGPRLAGRVPPWAGFSKYVRQPTDEMIPYTAKVLSDQELADIYAWLRAIPRAPAVSTIPLLKD